ncbi:hypothetical protein [Paenibacillus sp. FSL M7-0896]
MLNSLGYDRPAGRFLMGAAVFVCGLVLDGLGDQGIEPNELGG